MRQYRFLCLSVLLFAVSAIAEYKPGSDKIPSFVGYVQDEFIVVVRQDASETIKKSGTPGNAFGGVASLEALSKRFKADRVKRQFPDVRGARRGRAIEQRLMRYYKVRFRGGNLKAAMAAYGAHPLVERVERIGIHTVSAAANDTYYRDPPASFAYDQWHYWGTYGINAETAWDDESGDPSVVVGVLDTGVKYYHNDLGGPVGLWGPNDPQPGGNIWINSGEIPANGTDDDGNGYVDDTIGYDFVTDTTDLFTLCTDADCSTADNDPDDGEGHGTHVAGTVAAITNNDSHVAGIAGGFADGTIDGVGNGVKVMCLRVGWRAFYLLAGQEIGVVRMDYAAEAMNYVADMVAQGVNVVAVNCSWGSSNSGGLDAAVDRLLAAGVMVIHAAGNSDADSPDYLGTKDGVMNVGATNQSGAAADFTSYGSWVDVAAPGESIMSTYHHPDDPDLLHMYVALMSGTSMSSPHACGVAALIESKGSRLGLDLDGADIFDIMTGTATTAYSGSKDLGAGILNAKEALDSLGPACDVSADFSATPTTACDTLTANFTDLSTGAIISWYWDFGDGATSTDQNPQHAYDAPGSYTVSLTVTSATCSHVKIKMDYITVASAPIAAFSLSPPAGYAPLTVSFTDESVGNPALWNWDFGDGASSAQQNPSHTYADAGTYSVTLAVDNACGSDTHEKVDVITVEVQSLTQAFALGDISVQSDVFGDYAYTHIFDFDYELLMEVFSGGNSQKRRSLLDHRWEFDVRAGDRITFNAAAFTIVEVEDEGFEFQYSTNNSSYQHVMPVSGYDMGIFEATLPNDLEGTVYIRVVDLGRARGEQARDFVAVDYLCIESEGTSVPPPPTSGYMYVQCIAVTRLSVPGKKFQGRAEVVVVDQDQEPVSGARVRGYFEGPTNESVSDVTGADGGVVFMSKRVRDASANWRFTVTDVEYPGLTYKPEKGVQADTE